MGTQREKVIVTAEDRVSKPMKQAESGFTKFTKTLKGAAATGAIIAAGTAIIKLGVSAVGMAVDAEEAAAAFTTTFGPAVGSMNKFIDEFANKAGFANYELEQMLAITGNVIQGIGATEQESAALAQSMAVLAGDVASFSNASGGAEAVLAALQSAINGEREALKTYGLAISETEVQQVALTASGKASASELTRLDKALATVELAYEKAGKAVGDLDRTQDSNANTMRRVQAAAKELMVEFGVALTPILDVALPLLGQLIEDLGPAFIVLASSVADVAVEIIDMAQPILDVIGFLSRYTTETGDASESSSILSSGLGLVTDGLKTMMFGAAAATAKVEDMASAAQQAEFSVSDLTQAELDAKRSAEQWGEATLDNTAAVDALAVSLGSVTIADRLLQDSQEITTKFTKAEAVAMLEARDAAVAVADADREYRSTLSTLEEQLYDATLAQQSLSNAMLEAASPAFAAASAADRLRSAQANLETVLDDSKASADEVAQAQLDLASATLEAQARFDDLDGTNLEAALDSIATALGISRQEAADLLTELDILDGGTTKHLFDIEVPDIPTIRVNVSIPTWRFTDTGAVSSTGRILMHGGGLVPRVAGGGDVATLLEPGELVIPKGGISVADLQEAIQGTAGTQSHVATSSQSLPPIIIEVPVSIDGREVARVTTPHITREITNQIGRYRG